MEYRGLSSSGQNEIDLTAKKKQAAFLNVGPELCQRPLSHPLRGCAAEKGVLLLT